MARSLYTPVMDWFTPIHIREKKSKAALVFEGKSITRFNSGRSRKLISPSKLVKSGVAANVGGVQTRLYTVADVCRLLNVGETTVLRWLSRRYFPDPYIEEPCAQGGTTRYWTYGQLYACVFVLNDLYRQGVKSLHASHVRHFHLMRAGAARELEFELGNNLRRLQRSESPVMKEGGNYSLKEVKKPFGVEWESGIPVYRKANVDMQDLMPQS